MKKRIMGMLAAMLMVLAIMPMTLVMSYAAETGWIDIGAFNYYINPRSREAIVCGRADGNTDAEISIPASITYDNEEYAVKIDANAFFNDALITKLTVADGVTFIGGYAFGGCSELEDITLPDSITYVCKDSFEGTDFYNDSGNWDGDVLYIGNCLIAGNVSGGYTVKAGTVVIADYAFEEAGLTSVSIPASMLRIGRFAFNSCGSLSSVTFAENSSLTEIGGGAFSRCSSLTSIDIPASVNIIGQLAFVDTGLTSIVLPEGLGIIDFHLFNGCSSLKEVTIPLTVTEIWASAFSGCEALATVKYGGSPSQWAAIKGNGKPNIELVNFGKTDVEVSLALSVYENEAWISADSPVYVSSAFINGKAPRTAQVPVGEKATITITPADGYMVSGVSVNGSSTPQTSVQDYSSSIDQATGVYTITFTPVEGESYAFSVSLQEDAYFLGHYTVSFDENYHVLDDIASTPYNDYFYDVPAGTILAPIVRNGKGDILDAEHYKASYSECTFYAERNEWDKIDDDVWIDHFPTEAGVYFCKVEGIEPYHGTYEWIDLIRIIDKTTPDPNPTPSDPTPTTDDPSSKPADNPSKSEPVSIAKAKVVLSKKAFTYNGKVQKPAIKTIGGKKLKSGTDYTAKWSKAKSKNAGTYTVTITGKGNYTGQTKATYKINKAANPLKIKGKKATVTAKALKNKNKTLKAEKVIKFMKKLKDKKTYTLSSAKMDSMSFKKFFKINAKKGSLTVKKGLEEGTYKVKVKVKAAGNKNYKASVKTVTISITVK